MPTHSTHSTDNQATTPSDRLRASQNPFDGFAHVLGRIEQSNGLKIDFRRHSSDRPPDDQATKPDARRT